MSESRAPGAAAVVIRPPRTAAELVAELERAAAADDAFWQRFEIHEFFAPIGRAWSPADNVRHLAKSTRPVASALRLPAIVVRAMFGGAERPSRDYPRLVADYRAALAAGGDAGRYAPRPLTGELEPSVERERILAAKRTADVELVARAGRWRERALDRAVLPHPLLGKLTVREMLFFTLYHGAHHVANVERRLAATARPSRG